jgi:ribosomal protein S12 methylthiotransferase
MRSKPLKRILAEARQLMEDGAFELNLIGQDTTSYGEDIGYEAGLVGLLENLDRVAQEHGGAWIRLMYAYPSCFTDAMIDAIATLENVVKYIDMPLQHINDRVLDRMRRRTSRRLIESLLNKLRNRVPKIAIRTTLISGFPGETEQEHDELLRFVQDFRFDHLGVFAYSSESGTPAGSLHAQGDAIPPPLVQERLDQLMVAQQQIVFERNCQAAELGMRADVLIDEALGPIGQGRMSNQAPQIDGLTTVRAHKPLLTGDLLPCRIVKANGYDLTGEPVTNSNLPILNSPGTT